MSDRGVVGSELSLGQVKDELEGWPLDRRAFLQLGGSYLVLSLIGLTIGWFLLGPLSDTIILDWDRSLAVWFAESRTETLNAWSNVASGFSDTLTIVIALPAVILLTLFTLKRWRGSLTLGLGVALETAVFLTVSMIIGRNRPPVEQLDPSPPTGGFPSGHTGAAFAFYAGIALLVFWNTDSAGWRISAAVLAVVAPVGVMLSRMYRGMHFLTDVVVGAVFGLTCVIVAASIVSAAIRRRKPEEVET